MAARVFVAAFAFFDIQSVSIALGYDLSNKEAKLPEGTVVSVACWIAILARWAAMVVFALNAHGSSPYRLLTAKDPIADYSRVITTAFSLI